MALIEYVIHRWPMHNLRFVKRTGIGADVFNAHGVLHHGRYFRERLDYDADPASQVISIRMEALYNFAGLSPIWLPILLWVSTMGGLIFALVTVLHALAWTQMHLEMHMPKSRWFEQSRYYRYVRACHFAHHYYPGTNFGAVFPGAWDRVFGTYHEPIESVTRP